MDGKPQIDRADAYEGAQSFTSTGAPERSGRDVPPMAARISRQVSARPVDGPLDSTIGRAFSDSTHLADDCIVDSQGRLDRAPVLWSVGPRSRLTVMAAWLLSVRTRTTEVNTYHAGDQDKGQN